MRAWRLAGVFWVAGGWVCGAQERPAVLWVGANARTGGGFRLELGRRPRQVGPLMKGLKEALGCSGEGFRTGADTDEQWSMAGTCDGMFRRRGLTVRGEIRLEGLREALRQERIDELKVSVAHAQVGYSTVSGSEQARGEPGFLVVRETRYSLEEGALPVMQVEMGYYPTR